MDKNNSPRAGVSSSVKNWKINDEEELAAATVRNFKYTNIGTNNLNPSHISQGPLRGQRIQPESLTLVQPNTRNSSENLSFDSQRVMRDVIKQYPPKKRPYESQSSNEVHSVQIPNESNRFLDMMTYTQKQVAETYETDINSVGPSDAVGIVGQSSPLDMSSKSSSPDTISNVITLPTITDVSQISNVLENSLNSMPNIEKAIIIPIVLCHSNNESTTNRSPNTEKFYQSPPGIERNFRTETFNEFAQEASMHYYGGGRQIQDVSHPYNSQEVRSTLQNIHYQRVINLEAQEDSSNNLANSHHIFSALNHSTYYPREIVNSQPNLHQNSESMIHFTQNNFHFPSAQNQTQMNPSLQPTLLSTHYESGYTEHESLKYMPNAQKHAMSYLPHLYDVNKHSSSDQSMSYTTLPSTSQYLPEIPLRTSVIDNSHNVRCQNFLPNEASVNQSATSTRFPIVLPWARLAPIPEELLNGNSDLQPLQTTTQTVVASRGGRGSKRGRGRGRVAKPRQAVKRTTPPTKGKLKCFPNENPTLSLDTNLASTSVVPKTTRVSRNANNLQLETEETLRDVANDPISQSQNTYPVQNPTTIIKSSDEKKVEFCTIIDSMYSKDDIESSEEKLAKDKIRGGVKDIRTGVVDIMRIMKEKIREEAVRDYLSGTYSLPPDADSSSLSVITIDEDIVKTTNLKLAVPAPKTPPPK